MTLQKEIEDDNTKFYSRLYAWRDTNSSEQDIADFMREKGYDMFKDCVIALDDPFRKFIFSLNQA